MAETRFFHVSPKGKMGRLQNLKEALEFQKKGDYVWLDFHDPTREQLDPLIEAFGVHPLSIEDCLDDDQIPKMEDYPTNTFFLFNYYGYENKEVLSDEIDFCLGKNFLISVSGHNSQSPNFFDKFDERLSRSALDIGKGPEYLLYVILDYIIDRKFAVIDRIQEEVEASEEKILKSPDDFQPGELMQIRACLLKLRKSLFHEREVLIRVCRKDSPFIGEKAIYFYRDIYDHLAKFLEFVEINREMLTSLMELYLSGINNRMAMVSNQINQVMRRLTTISVIFMPLTILSGVGGMSEWSYICGPENWKISYPAFFLLMGGIGYLNYWLLRKLDWL